MFKITEFSNITGLTIRTLHYYDEIGLHSPKREDNGHREYSYKDLIIINEIILLKDMGYKLENITEYLKPNASSDLKNSLYRQRQFLLNKIQEIEKQLSNIDGLLQSNVDSQTLEDKAIRKAFIDKNPLKERVKSIWNLDFHDKNSLQYFKSYSGSINFDVYFKKLAELQHFDVSEDCVQEEVSKYICHLQDNYGDSFNINSISNFAFLYIENEEAINHLKQYGDGFNKFLFNSLIHFSQNIEKRN